MKLCLWDELFGVAAELHLMEIVRTVAVDTHALLIMNSSVCKLWGVLSIAIAG